MRRYLRLLGAASAWALKTTLTIVGAAVVVTMILAGLGFIDFEVSTR